MPEARAEDLMDPIPIPIKALVPAISRDDRKLQELAEDCSPNPGTSNPKTPSENLRMIKGINGTTQRGEIRITGFVTTNFYFNEKSKIFMFHSNLLNGFY